MNRYDETKKFLNKIRLLNETSYINNVKQFSEDDSNELDDYNYSDIDINGVKIKIDSTDDFDKKISQEESTKLSSLIDTIKQGVTDLVTFGDIMIYENNAKWSGRVETFNIDFIYETGDETGLFLTGQLLEITPETINLINNLFKFKNLYVETLNQIISVRKTN